MKLCSRKSRYHSRLWRSGCSQEKQSAESQEAIDLLIVFSLLLVRRFSSFCGPLPKICIILSKPAVYLFIYIKKFGSGIHAGHTFLIVLQLLLKCLQAASASRSATDADLKAGGAGRLQKYHFTSLQGFTNNVYSQRIFWIETSVCVAHFLLSFYTDPNRRQLGDKFARNVRCLQWFQTDPVSYRERFCSIATDYFGTQSSIFF